MLLKDFLTKSVEEIKTGLAGSLPEGMNAQNLSVDFEVAVIRSQGLVTIAPDFEKAPCKLRFTLPIEIRRT